MHYHSRPYEGEADYELMRGLLRATYVRAGPPTYASIGDIDWWRSAEDDPDHLSAQLWFHGDQLVGFAWPADPQVDMFSLPEHRAVEYEMLAWSEEWRRRTPAADQPKKLRAWSFHNDRPRYELLLSHGYQLTGTGLQYRLRPEIGALPHAPIPEGYVIRNVAGLHEAEQRVAVHRDAFAPSQMTLTFYQTATRMPTYRQDLDLVAVAPDGIFAAFCIVWWDAETRLGVFEPVGCHSEHRRRGLARAVMIEGLRRLEALGATAAQVTTGVSNQAAGNLYEQLGFELRDENWGYDKLFGETA